MAYASLAHTIDLFLNHDKYSISVDEKEKIVSIHEYAIFLQWFLEDFPEKASILEGKIRDVANEAEDILESFMSMQIRPPHCSWMRRSTVATSRVEFEHQLEKATEEIAFVAEEIMEIKKSFKIEDDGLGDPPAPISSSRLESAGESVIVIGLHDDLIAIKKRLCRESSKLEVIPIVGMGGIGKTTLARNAYDDPLIMERFHIRIWLTVSQDYSARKVLLSLLESMKLLEKRMLEQNNVSIMAEMEEKVYKNLKGRRYLFVMDDVWSMNAWDDVRRILPDDSNGSRIMFTTRLSNLAADFVRDSSPLHEMQLMDGNRSWELLKHKVFSNSGDSCPPELEDIGKEIARSCRGLPLAIVVVAGILSTVDKSRASWEEIAKNVNPVVASREEQFAKILSLSYTNLPHHLRPCFLFIGGFPEDYKIHVSRLIKLWVAEGFLRCRDGSKSLEEEAEEYLEDLVKRSLVLVTSRKTSGKIKSCSLHDLVRDLCIRKA